MRLSHPQKKFLRELGHKLRPVIMVGDAGVTDALVKEFDATIAHHELIKVRIRAADREERNRLVDELCRRGTATMVSRVGNTALLYRPRQSTGSDTPRIRLPEGR